MNFDLSKDVGNNIFFVNKYNLQIKREYKYVTYFAGPAFGILLISVYASLKAAFPWWSFLFCILLAVTVVMYWSYKKYAKDIASILRSLDEIKELKEA